MTDAGAFLTVFSGAVFSPGGYGRWTERDPMIAVENMILARALLVIPRDKKVICLLPIGVPAEESELKPRRTFLEVFHAETYGKPLEF